jgi:hypothetical protein
VLYRDIESRQGLVVHRGAEFAAQGMAISSRERVGSKTNPVGAVLPHNNRMDGDAVSRARHARCYSFKGD